MGIPPTRYSWRKDTTFHLKTNMSDKRLMNICVGVGGIKMSKAMRVKTALCIPAFLLLLSGCNRFQETELVGLPVGVSLANSQEIDIGTIVENTQLQVESMLPGAYLNGFGFYGPCQGLADFHGRISLSFVQVHRILLFPKMFVAFADVDTTRRTLDIETHDFSALYPNTTYLSPESISAAREIAGIAYKHITDLGMQDCDVALVRLSQTWHVSCTEPGSGPVGPSLGNFEIDAETWRIVTK